jgi:hypothetical protein
MARGRGKREPSAENACDGMVGSIGSVGAPWDKKSEGKRDMVSGARKRERVGAMSEDYMPMPSGAKPAFRKGIVSRW